MTTTRTNKKTTCTFTCQVSRFMCTVLVLVVIGVGRLIVRFHHAYAIPSFLLGIVVRLYLVIVKSDCSHNYCLLHIAKTGHLRCCLYINCFVTFLEDLTIIQQVIVELVRSNSSPAKVVQNCNTILSLVVFSSAASIACCGHVAPVFSSKSNLFSPIRLY